MISDTEQAKDYISSMYAKEKHLINFEAKIPPSEVTTKLQESAVSYDHFLVHGEGGSPEEAWSNFWADFSNKKALSEKSSALYWRRVPTLEHIKDFGVSKEKFRVTCRFSAV